ncbi:MAG: hypothetical protein HY697_01495 [Deltaproteobacteria bacterium]|nr:hypothetical protein [Deltaproteobacteria bacterium]
MRQDARAEEGSRREYREKCREVREVLEGYLTRLKTGDLKSEQLRIEKSVRQKRNEYQVGTVSLAGSFPSAERPGIYRPRRETNKRVPAPIA